MCIFYIQTMPTQKRRKKQTINKRKAKNGRKKRTIRRRKMRGGVSFNDPVNFSNIPKADYYPLNTYTGGDPQRDIIDSRLLPNMTSGGRKKVSRRNRTKRSRRRRPRKMKGGGSLMGTDLATGLTTSTSNEALSFGTTGGSQLMYDRITAASIPDPALHTDRIMVPIA